MSLFVYIFKWVLVKVPPRLKPIELLSAFAGGGYVMLSRCELSEYDNKSLTVAIVGNMFREYQASCMLKMPFVDFDKEKADCTRYSRLIIVHLPNSLMLF
jgi:hypothetical protein